MEEALKLLIDWADHNGDGLIIYDEKGTILVATNNIQELFSESKPLAGKNIGDFLLVVGPPEGSGQLMGIKARKVRVDFKEPMKLDFASGVLFQNNGCRLLDLTGAQGLDIDFRNKLSDIPSEFVSQIAHEIRNPLAGIRTTMEVLSLFVGEKERRYCRLIQDEIDRVSNLLRNLIDLTVPGGYGHGRSSLKKVLYECVAIHEAMADNQGVKIEIEMDLTDHIVPLSENRLRSVFQNIIVNAIQSMKKGGELRISCAEHMKEWVIVRISDTGPGIEKGMLEQIFKPFLSGRKGGTGLGLAVAKRFVEEAGGRIRVESELGRGTDFYLYFPVCGKAKNDIRGRE